MKILIRNMATQKVVVGSNQSWSVLSVFRDSGTEYGTVSIEMPLHCERGKVEWLPISPQGEEQPIREPEWCHAPGGSFILNVYDEK